MLSLISSPPELGGVRGGMNQGHTKLAFSQINESSQSDAFDCNATLCPWSKNSQSVRSELAVRRDGLISFAVV